MKRRKLWIWGGIAIALMILLTIFAAPNNNKILAGSTYSKEPNGYGAWYEYMQAQGHDIQRWQKPFADFLRSEDNNNATYLQIIPTQKSYLSGFYNKQYEWVTEGNTLVLLGQYDFPATDANFETNQFSPDLDLTVAIATSRRNLNASDNILNDEYGSIMWRQEIEQGEIIYAITPYLAANAYQNVADNFEFLAQIVNKKSTIFVDEYIHGYKDIETKMKENQDTLIAYFLKTPWYPISIQLILIMLVAIAFAWRRFGQPVIPKLEQLDNSKAYIEALARVLEKAESTDFIVETISQDEQKKLQRYLGLGRNLLDDNILITAWQQQTGTSSAELQEILRMTKMTKEMANQISERELIIWLQKWKKLNNIKK